MAVKIANGVTLVTGGNRGIGKVIVEQMLEAGVAKVYIAVRDPDSAKEIVEASGGKAVAIPLDLTKPETVKAAAQTASDVEIVVNNGGILKVASPLSEDAFEALDAEIDVNVKGLLRVAQAFAPVLKNNGGGALVQLNSVASLRNFADFATYSASKAASYSITQGLRDKLSEQGTHVVSVHPGPIDTDMAQEAGLEDSAEPPSVVADGIIHALKSGEFHVFPDSMAKEFWEAYQGFAKSVVESDVDEG